MTRADHDQIPEAALAWHREGKGAALRRGFAARDIVRVQVRQIDENRPFTRDEV